MSEFLDPTPRILAHSECVLGENPLWHPDHKSLYWCDITVGRLYRHCLSSSCTEIVVDGNGAPDRRIGGFTLEADGALLLFMAEGRVERWDGSGLETVLPGRPELAHARFNDVIADPRGRVFCGTLSDALQPGILYQLDVDRTLTEITGGIGCANGLAFTADLRHLYFTDSVAKVIYQFDYDAGTGALRNQSIFLDSNEEDGVPDGLTIDADGDFWSARWEGSRIDLSGPDGVWKRSLRLPVSRVTSLTFGGEDLASLFITTARSYPGRSDSPEGNVFICRPGAKGRPEFRSRITS